MQTPYRLALSILAALAVVLPGSAMAAAKTAPRPRLTGMWVIDQKSFDKTDFDHQPPYRPDALASFKAEQKAVEGGKVLSDGARLCRPMGMPTFMMNEFALEILETRGRITMINEASSVVRSIYLDKTVHQNDIEPMWNGHSIGHWEGAVLVIDTANLNDKANHITFGGSGPTSDRTHIVERIHLEGGGNSLVDEITIDDPKLMTAPYKVTKRFRRLPEDAQLWESVCEVDAPGWSERFKGDPAAKPPGSGQ